MAKRCNPARQREQQQKVCARVRMCSAPSTEQPSAPSRPDRGRKAQHVHGQVVELGAGGPGRVAVLIRLHLILLLLGAAAADVNEASSAPMPSNRSLSSGRLRLLLQTLHDLGTCKVAQHPHGARGADLPCSLANIWSQTQRKSFYQVKRCSLSVFGCVLPCWPENYKILLEIWKSLPFLLSTSLIQTFSTPSTSLRLSAHAIDLSSKMVDVSSVQRHAQA